MRNCNAFEVRPVRIFSKLMQFIIVIIFFFFCAGGIFDTRYCMLVVLHQFFGFVDHGRSQARNDLLGFGQHWV